MPEDLDDALDVWDLDEDIPDGCLEGDHTGECERMVFNGGNPWWICDGCGSKLRDARYDEVADWWY